MLGAQALVFKKNTNLQLILGEMHGGKYGDIVVGLLLEHNIAMLGLLDHQVVNYLVLVVRRQHVDVLLSDEHGRTLVHHQRTSFNVYFLKLEEKI